MARTLPTAVGLLSSLVLDPELLQQQPSGIGDVDAGLGRALRQLLLVRPGLDQVQRLLMAHDAAIASGASAPHQHHSTLRPAGDQPFYGAIDDFPLPSAMAAGVNLPGDELWDVVALLAAAETILPRLGINCAPLSARHRKELEVWLRNAHKGSRLRDMRLATGGASTPAGILQAETLGGPRGRMQAAVRSAAEALLAAAPTRAGDQPSEDAWSARAARIVSRPIPAVDRDEQLPTEELPLSVSIELDPDDQVYGPAAQHELVQVASARQHAHLLIAESLATRHEYQGLASAVSEVLTTSPDAGALGAGLVMVTACSPMELMLAPVCTTWERALCAIQSHPVVLYRPPQGTSCVLQRVVRPSDCFQRTEAHESSFEKHNAFLVQALPCILAQSIPHGELRALGIAYPEIEPATRNFAEHVRRISGGRQHIGRIRRALYAEIMGATGDECLAQLVLPQADVPVGQGIYYAATTIGRAFELHSQACQPFFQMPSETPAAVALMSNTWIGSAVNPSLRRVVDDLAVMRRRACRAVRGRRTVAGTVEAVNHVTHYTLALLNTLTARRPSRDSWQWSDFDASLGVALITDKAVHGRFGRIVPLAKPAIEQLAVYSKTMLAAADAVRVKEPKLASLLAGRLDPGGAFTSIRDKDGTWQEDPIRPTELLTGIPSLANPINANRHVLLQQLMAHQVPREQISFLAGHAEAGQALFSATVPIAPVHAFQQLRAELDAIAGEIGARPCDPLRQYVKRRRQAKMGIAA